MRAVCRAVCRRRLRPSLQAFALADGKPLWTAAVGGSGARLFTTPRGSVWAAAVQG